MNLRIRSVAFTALILLLVGAGTFFVSSTMRTHAASPELRLYGNASQNGTSFHSLTTPPSWVTQAAGYVRVSKGVATVDTSISKHLNTQEVIQVKQAVQYYNLHSPGVKEVSSMTYTNATLSHNSCTIQLYQQRLWWGIQTYVNSCGIDYMVNTLGTASKVYSFLAKYTPCVWVCSLVANLIIVYKGWLQWDNWHCGYRGAYVDSSWGNSQWIQPVC